MELLEAAMLMTEHAFFTKVAGLLMIKCSAILRFEELIIGLNRCLGQFVLTMGVAAEFLVSALGSLDPILTQLGLPLAISVSGHVERWQRLLESHCARLPVDNLLRRHKARRERRRCWYKWLNVAIQ